MRVIAAHTDINDLGNAAFVCVNCDLHDLKGRDLNFSGLLETPLSARTSMNQSADRYGKTLPKANGG